MSKLEKAMERAKLAREGSPPLAVASNAPAGGPRNLDVDPTYTQTRVYSADEEALKRHGVLSAVFHPAIVEQYNLLRAKVLGTMTLRGYSALLISSPSPGEGKTLTAVNLALSMARETSRTVLLIDTDMRQPSVHQCLGLPDGPGLYEHLTEGTPLNELLVNPGFPRLTVLPAGRPTEYPADLLGGPVMENLVREVKGRYADRYIIFDSPPLLAFADGLYLARYADAVLMVVRSGDTNEESLKQAIELLGDRPILGTVLNRVPKQQTQWKSYRYS
jgi:protein-tyrosine kinase